MRIQIASDLHFEFFRYITKLPLSNVLDIEKDIDVLILAGDIFYINEGQMVNIIADGLNYAKHVIFVPGNHDFWHANILDIEIFKQYFNMQPNIHVLYNESTTIDGIEFFGGTMWANPRLQALGFMTSLIADFNQIKNFHSYSIIDKWNDFVLELSRSDPDVVISHFAAFPQSIHPQYEGHFLNEYFCTDMGPYVPKNTKLWVHGHVHNSFDYITDFGLRVVCNPRGYEGYESNLEFSRSCVVEI